MIAVRQTLDEFVGQCRSRGHHHRLIRGQLVAVTNVLQRVGGEDHGILRDDADLRAQGAGVEFAQIDAVEADRTFGHVEVAQQQLEQGGLAGAAGADQGHRLAGIDVERDVIQRLGLGPRRVAEHHRVEGDTGRPFDREFARSGRCLDRGFGVQQFHQALGGAGSAHDVAPDLREHADTAGGEGRVEHERSQLTGAHRARTDGLRTQPQHEHDGAEDAGNHAGRHQRAHANATDRGAKAALDRVVVALRLVTLMGEGLHRGNGIENFTGHGGGIGDTVLRFA